jgi:hypothetical protein
LNENHSAAPDNPKDVKDKGSHRFFEFTLGSLFSLVALLVSFYSLYDSQRARSYVASTSSLSTEYSLYKELAKLQHDNPLLSYLFSPSPADYINVRNQVKATLQNKTPDERTKLQLEEKALVSYIYTSYEETFYNWAAASNASDNRLADLLKGNLEYFQSFLCNPRLVWYWGSEPYRFDRQLGIEPVKYYEKTVQKDCRVTRDSSGAF